jgi:DNA-directed RNA polymerase subunit alpha
VYRKTCLEILANLKEVKFRMTNSDVEVLYLKKKGEGPVYAKDFSLPPNVELITPEVKSGNHNRPKRGTKYGSES